MFQPSLLSAEISRARAVIAGGAPSSVALQILREWENSLPARGLSKNISNLKPWNKSICKTLFEAIPIGSSVGMMLKSVQPMIRREEKHWVKLQSIERQFGFQGAIALVLPWAVAALNGGIEFNFFTYLGILFQVLGFVAFSFLLKYCSSQKNDEKNWLFGFCLSVWIQVLSSISFQSALKNFLDEKSQEPAGLKESFYCHHWQQWLSTVRSLDSQTEFIWSDAMSESAKLSKTFKLLFYSGAPAQNLLADLLEQMDDDRQSIFEERVSAIPVRLSLLFCFFFVPAVFLILFGSLWPILKNLNM